MNYFKIKSALISFILLLTLLCTACTEASFVDDSWLEAPPDESFFEAHFIDVGQADASLVICDGKAMLIDGGNADDSNLIYSYLKKNDIKHLDYIVATHAHEDHVGGLVGALVYATADKIYCPVTENGTKSFKNFVKYAQKQELSITVPTVGEKFSLGSAEAIVLACNSDYDANESSIILKVTYGETSFLFTGDAEKAAEQAALASGYDLKSTVLKVGHHGSSTSTGYPFLREILPEYAVISVGKDNSYGHPSDQTLSKLRDADAVVYRTDMQGDIICRSDGKAVTFTVAKNADADTLYPILPKENTALDISEPQTELESDTSDGANKAERPASENTDDEQERQYILNTNSHKFHYPTCTGIANIKDANRKVFSGTRSQVIEKGYFPCGRCNP